VVGGGVVGICWRGGGVGGAGLRVFGSGWWVWFFSGGFFWGGGGGGGFWLGGWAVFLGGVPPFWGGFFFRPVPRPQSFSLAAHNFFSFFRCRKFPWTLLLDHRIGTLCFLFSLVFFPDLATPFHPLEGLPLCVVLPQASPVKLFSLSPFFFPQNFTSCFSGAGSFFFPPSPSSLSFARPQQLLACVVR